MHVEKQTLNFLKNLARNNDKAWFDAHRNLYEAAKHNMEEVAAVCIAGIAKFDAPIGELLPKKCTFRINRDVRFSKNKQPYKNNMGLYFNKDGKNGNGAGYYLHIEPGAAMLAGGIWMPEAPVLAKIRQEIDYNFDAWKKITESKTFLQHFENGVQSSDTLVRPPKGYDENNPAIAYLKLKSFTVSHSLPDDVLTGKDFVKTVTSHFKVMKPMLDFLNEALQ